MAVSTSNAALYRANAAASVATAYPQTGTAQNSDLIQIKGLGEAVLARVDSTGAVTGGATNSVLSAVAVSSFAVTSVGVVGAATTYNGTFTGGGAGAFNGKQVKILGFVTNPTNNGTFVITASTATTLVVTTVAQVNETASATASVFGVSTATYTGTATGSPAAGQLISVTGFTNASNNINNTAVSSSSPTTLVVLFAGQIAETHVASANIQSAALAPTAKTRIGEFKTNLSVTATVAQLFQSAFFPANQGAIAIAAGASPDILWIVNEGGNVSYYLDAAGVAHGS